MFKLLPWKPFVRYAARRYGVLDPATLLARLRRFAQPSEVGEPLELLRAGIVFHARGLVNSKAIQHNLDWVWPFWVERQFNPGDPSFVPRAFSFSHINLTHRNWTAVGCPGLAVYPIVDPRGLVTPLFDGWSLDFWIVTDSGRKLLPSKLPDSEVEQHWNLGESLEVATQMGRKGLGLHLITGMTCDPAKNAEVITEIKALSNESGWLVVAVRPYNPEGVQFIHRIESHADGRGLAVNREADVRFSLPPAAFRMSHYAEGDVYLDLSSHVQQQEIACDVGLATAAALFRLEAGQVHQLHVNTTLKRDLMSLPSEPQKLSWNDALAGTASLRIHHAKTQFLYDAALRTLLLLSAGDLVPGPYTYRRFWFRDACLMLQPLAVIGQIERAGRILADFPKKQTRRGYFLSQEGEWDSNGQVLWIAARYAALTGAPLDDSLEAALRKAVTWLDRKRLDGSGPHGTRGLLPAGFSAEHLGPNDFYYWDDFWAWGGLDAIASYWESRNDLPEADRARTLALAFRASVEASIAAIPESRSQGAIPAAPGRRMDAGAVGSMVADYPLRLYPPNHPPLARTADFLIERCFHSGGFFQEMIHSGINAYLTLDLAQTLLRNGDDRYPELVRRVAELASPTGQWPEAIHPLSLGGCMGDGQHGWAAAEWIMIIRNAFVREEDDRLIIGSGILPEWLDGEEEIRFGPTLTPWGSLTVRIAGPQVTLESQWRAEPPLVRIAVPGYETIEANGSETLFHLQAHENRDAHQHLPPARRRSGEVGSHPGGSVP